jgi:predicted Fe-S protein YdhL (DUF1289 family)
MKNFRYTVIENYCKDKLVHQPSEFSFDMTNEEIENWKKEEDAMREEILNSSPERFGLIIRGYYLPHTAHNVVFYEQSQEKHEEMIRRIEQKRTKSNGGKNIRTTPIMQQDICFFFEETTEQFQATDGWNNLIQQLIAFNGVTENDIEKRTPRFLMYISTLRDMRKLPSFHKE